MFWYLLMREPCWAHCVADEGRSYWAGWPHCRRCVARPTAQGAPPQPQAVEGPPKQQVLLRLLQSLHLPVQTTVATNTRFSSNKARVYGIHRARSMVCRLAQRKSQSDAVGQLGESVACIRVAKVGFLELALMASYACCGSACRTPCAELRVIRTRELRTSTEIILRNTVQNRTDKIKLNTTERNETEAYINRIVDSDLLG